jgi:hypothetical protein
MPLHAILLRLLYGRVGSSLLMQLLASSGAVACDHVMPYERRYLAYFVRICGEAGATCSLSAAWQAFSEATRARSPDLRYYAEKSVGSLDPIVEAGIPIRVIDVVRDPRDIFVSARAFSRRIGREAFGLRLDVPDAVNLPLFLADLSARVDVLGRPAGGVPPLLVRYEDMMSDLASVAGTLGPALGITLDPDHVRAQAIHNQSHMTARSPAESVGRWRDELDPGSAAVLTRMLAPTLARWGYTLDGALCA